MEISDDTFAMTTSKSSQKDQKFLIEDQNETDVSHGITNPGFNKLDGENTNTNIKQPKVNGHHTETIRVQVQVHAVPEVKVDVEERKNDETCSAASQGSIGRDGEGVNTLLSLAALGDLTGITQLCIDNKTVNLWDCNKEGFNALHAAASGGRLGVIKYLREKGLNMQAVDRQGNNALHYAARQGHLPVVIYLYENGFILDVKNKSGETPVHMATQNGRLGVLEYLCSNRADLNTQDEAGRTALHIAVSLDNAVSMDAVVLLLVKGTRIDIKTKKGRTALLSAVHARNIPCTNLLLDRRADTNVIDAKGQTALHIACRKGCVELALTLLETGCPTDNADQAGNTPLHISANRGLASVVQALCGTVHTVDVFNKAGLTPLHVAASEGHLEVVRNLLLYGAEPNLSSKPSQPWPGKGYTRIASKLPQGRQTAADLAAGKGHKDIVQLLNWAKPSSLQKCADQLRPSDVTCERMKVKVFGSSGSGKSTLIDSLKTSSLSSLLPKSWFSKASSNKVKVKGDQLPVHVNSDGASLNAKYTRGVSVQQVNIPSAGELSVWEFSGYEPYYITYDYFIGDPSSVNIITFDASQPDDVQRKQVQFWLEFIQCRVPPLGPILNGGKLAFVPMVILVATHCDHLTSQKGKDSKVKAVQERTNQLLADLRRQYSDEVFIAEHVYACDARRPGDVTPLRRCVEEVKMAVKQQLPPTNGLYDAILAALPSWRSQLASLPVVTWSEFVTLIRDKVNRLAAEEHISHMMSLLQVGGEIVNLESPDKNNKNDLIVLHPNWLCNRLIGDLLSHDRSPKSKVNGQLSATDVSSIVDVTDFAKLTKVLEALDLCVSGAGLLEFPCFNTLPPPSNIWEVSTNFPLYGGIRIKPARSEASQQLANVFPRVQVQLHRRLVTQVDTWRNGAKVRVGGLECLVTLETTNQVIDIRLRGDSEAGGGALYTLLEKVYDCVMTAMEHQCPSLVTQRHLLSVLDLRSHAPHVRSLSPRDILAWHLKSQRKVVHADGSEESLHDLVCFGSEEVRGQLVMGTDLHIAFLSPAIRRQLCRLLDAVDGAAADWRALATELGHDDLLPPATAAGGRGKADSDRNFRDGDISPTDRLLFYWSRDAGSTTGRLVEVLRQLGRDDAADTVLSGLPICVTRMTDKSTSASAALTSHPHGINATSATLSPTRLTSVSSVDETTQSTKM